VFSEAAFLHFLRVSCCNVSYAGGCFSYLSSGLRISVRFYIPKDNFSISHFMPPAVAKEGKGDFRGHPEPRQKTASSALLNRSLLRHQRMGKEGSGTPRVLAKDFVLCTLELFVATASEDGNGGVWGTDLHPPDARSRTPAKDFVLCTPID
jgi:hypothetical protein